MKKQTSIEDMIKEISTKEAHILCREVMSITDTMDELTQERQNKRTL